MPVVLGVALGPHACIVEARHADTGELVAAGRVRHADHSRDDDDPTAWWRSLTSAVPRSAAGPIAAMSVTGSHPGLVLLDGAGVVLRPVQAWDGARSEVARLQQALGPERWARRSGHVPDSGTAITRLAWLARTDPDTFAAIGTVLLPHEWLTYRLAGRPVIDRGSASLSGMWSPSSDSWLPEALGQLVPKAEVHRWVEHLPEVEPDPAAPADWLDAPVFELVGLAGRPLVACGTAEPMAVALALGLEPGSVGVSLTERTMVLAPIEAPVADPAGVVASRADAAGGHLAIAHSPGGAALVDAVAGLLDLTVPRFAQAASTVVPGEDDVIVVPGIDDRPGAVITGVGAGTGREELARATFEGVAGAALTALDAIAEAGVELYDGEPIHLVAPTAALEVHAQVLATLSGRPVVATSEATAAAGACVQAAAVLGRVHPSEVAAAWDLAAGTEVEPDHDPARHHRLAVNAEERARQRRAWRE